VHPTLNSVQFLQHITLMVLGSNKTGLRDSMSSKAQSSCEAAVIACVIGVLFALIGNDSELRQFTVSRRVCAVVTPGPSAWLPFNAV
jgi:hypothetical protein